jgi:hypothetical protein
MPEVRIKQASGADVVYLDGQLLGYIGNTRGYLSTECPLDLLKESNNPILIKLLNEGIRVTQAQLEAYFNHYVSTDLPVSEIYEGEI